MCFSGDSRPPIAPMAGGAVDGRDLVIAGADGNRFRAFQASASEPRGDAIIVLPDIRGLHRYYEELALRFAEAGVDALAIDYFGRSAGVGERTDDFDFGSHASRTTWAGLRSDVLAAAQHLRSDRSPKAVFTIGFCFGGRVSFLLASVPELEPSGAIGFYGWPVGTSRNDTPAPADVAAEMRCPVLAIFGGNDRGIPPDAVAAFEEALAAAGARHEVVTYPGAPHGFFDRKADEFTEASEDAWRRVLRFMREGAGKQPG